jgi:putative peptide zinc metalloprotease protein
MSSTLLRADLEVTDPGDDVAHVVVYDPVRSKYLRVQKDAFALLARSGAGEADDKRLAPLVARAASLHLLAGSSPEPRQGPRRRFSLAFWRVLEADPTPLLERFRPVINAVTSPVGWAVGCAIVLAGSVSFVEHNHNVHWSPALWIAVSAALTVAVVLHELGHASMVVRYGGRVRHMGIALMYLRPVLYCDVSAAWTLARRRQRVAVAFAGIFVNLVIGSVSWSLLWWPSVAHGSARFAVAFGLANFGLALFNLFPFIKLDGYWMLASAIDRPNFRSQAMDDAKTWAGRAVLGDPGARRLQVASVAFGVACLATPPLIVGDVVWQTWMWSGRLGPLGHAAWFAVTTYVAVRLLPRAFRKVRTLGHRPVRVFGLVPLFTGKGASA